MNKTLLLSSLSIWALIAQLPADIVRNAPSLPVLKTGEWDTLKLKWNRPEKDDGPWGTPIGNGEIAAKIKGGIAKEILQLNDKHFWSDWPGETTDSKRLEALALTRAKLADGDIPGASGAARGMWGPHDGAAFLPIGQLILDFPDHQNATDYQRVFDLDQALSTVTYESGGVEFRREAFASKPDRVIVMRVGADRNGKVTFDARLQAPAEMGDHASVTVEGGDLVLRGKAPSKDLKSFDPQKGMIFEARLRIKAEGGKVIVQGDHFRVEGADSALLLYTSETSYNGYRKEPGTEGIDPTPVVKEILAKASAKNYDALLSAHVEDYRSLFRRVWLEIDGEEPNKYALGFQYARSDMIETSRNGDRPHNQQGMWNNQWKPISNCSHFLNENVQKYYGLIETANLAATGEPLWNWMDQLAERGAITAKEDFGFSGWMAPHYSDIWANTAIKGGNNEWAIWPMGGVWLCQNLWDHYAFGQDKRFLADRAYPLMKGAAEFSLDYLVENKDGLLVTSPSTSPENQFRLVEGGPTYAVSEGATMDIALIRQLFENTIEAATILNTDAPFRARLEVALKKMPPYKVGANGELQEWLEDFPKRDNGHRHISHGVAVWPLSQITERQPELYAATIAALEARGGGGYHPDKAAMAARLKLADKAMKALGGNGHHATGQFPPLYAGLPEMLLFSHNRDDKGGYELELLPTLPAEWRSGKIDGIRARGGYELSLEWDNGQLTQCRIDSPLGTTPVVRYEGKVLDLARDKRVTLNLLK